MVSRTLWIGVFTFIIGYILIAMWVPAHGDIHYFSDNARDMLLLDQIVHEKPITLIGPRSGISGVFHGPLWLYLNLPAFIIGGGNPVALGWFWVLLFTLNAYIVYWVATKLFSWKSGLIASLLFVSTYYATGWSQFNANGVLMVMPVFLYSLIKYLETSKVSFLIGAYFLIGLLIQFQIAFGGPILIVTSGYLVYQLWKSKKWSHALSALTIVIPTATHIMFDLRHNFLQFNSFFGAIGSDEGVTLGHIESRLIMGLKALSEWLPTSSIIASLIITGVLFVLTREAKERTLQQVFVLFCVLYAGFWVVTSIYTGTMWLYYYWGFMPVLFILIAGAIMNSPKHIQSVLIGIILLLQVVNVSAWYTQQREKVIRESPISWKFHNNAVEDLFDKADTEFGYYVFTDDHYGYRPKYAFTYNDRKSEKSALLNTKKAQTYAYLMPTDSKDLTWEGWLQHQVKIDRDPDHKKIFENGIAIYRYDLSNEEQSIDSDPNLLDSLILR